MSTAQETMLAIAAQREGQDTKAAEDVAARQAAFDSDNAMAQQLALGPQLTQKSRENAVAANRARGRGKKTQDPAPTRHPAKGVVVDPDALLVETSDQDLDLQPEQQE